ncbi:DEAD/DEAH box helicase family protein [Ruminococcus sp.]|uniref:DEAD/DEAH box helicase family protein n=1 Tax=Ruminococcus sp. TaxID=41978 RepID=UPI0025D88047|nr:DEAD/DEAH box helicase family protein [Ruminococcus sp.]
MPNTVENLNAQTVIPANGTNPRTLYEHQVEALKALNAINKKPDFRTLLVLPTGGGKTMTAVYWLLQNAVDQGKKILWIAHRHLLLEQAADTFINNAYTSIMINHTTFRYRIISGMHDKPVHIKKDDNILIVSKDSINRSLERLDSWLKNEDVFLVIDEAHHAVAKTYRKTIKYVEEHAKSMKLLGLTATPFRTSEKEKGALSQIFTDDIVYKIDLNALIDGDILAYPKFIDGCETGVELGDMIGLKNIQEIENFDALPKNIQEFLQENNERNSFIVDHYVRNKEKYGKTIVFAINKTNAFALNALFRKNKIRSDYIVSDVRDAALGITISSKENEEKIKQYRDGKLDVLINVNILTEGTDLPQTHTVFLTRPTISRVFMTQMVGRALRGKKAGGTTDAYIVPFIDNWNGKIAWVNPQSLFKDEYEPQDTPAKKQQYELRMISISKIEEFAAMLNDGIDTSALEQIEMIERIPVGYYMFSTLEWNHQILIYNSTQSSYQALINDLPQIMELYKIEEETISDDVLSEMTDYCIEQYFDEAMVPACQRSDIEHLLLFFAQKAVDPLFVPLDDIVRKKLDVSDIAKKFEDEAMTGRERKAYLDNLWNAEDSVYKIYYSSPYIFKRMVDIEMDKLDGYVDTEYARPQTQAELRKLEDLKLEEIIRRYPNIGIPLKMKVFDKARNSDGNYVCAGCKKEFDNRQFLQVDHIKPMANGGKTVEENLQILCRTCNQRKGDK